MRLLKSFASVLFAAILTGCSAPPSKPPEPPPPPEPAISAAQIAAFEAAVALMRQGKNDDARQAFEALLEETGDTAGIHLNLALLHREKKQLEAALGHVDQALALAPDSITAHNLRGSLLRQSGDFLSARQAYERALAQEPEYGAAHLNLAILLDIYLKEWSTAKEHYQRYLALTEEPDPRVKFWLQDLEMRIRGAGS